MYQSYKRSLEKVKKFILGAYRWRFLIAAAFVCLVAVSLCLGLTGTVCAENVAAKVEYGSSLSPSCKAIFRAASYQYRAKGGAWSSEEPILVGEYECRAVSRGLGGKARYGKIHSYSIVPAPVDIKITSTALLYGEAPTYAAELFYGDVLTVSDFLYVRDEVDTVKVAADVNAATVRTADGDDVTSCYTFSAPSKTILSERRAITVATNSDEWEYDGEAHSASGCAVTSERGLVDGHTLVVATCEIEDVGTRPNSVTSARISDENGEDVTAFYDIEYALGTLTVLPRKIVISTESGSFRYDGTGHSIEGFRVSSDIKVVDGQRIEASFDSFVNAGEHSNVATVGIFDGDDEKTDNYDIEFDLGTVTITPRPLTIRTGSETWVYDGDDHYCLDYEYVGGLIEGHDFAAEVTGQTIVVDVGETDNELSLDFAVTSARGDETSNYDIELSCGTLSITPKQISVITGSGEFIYDGTPKAREFRLADGNSLTKGHVMTITSVGMTEVTDSETDIKYRDNVLQFEVHDQNAVDRTDDYEVTGEWGSVRIKTPIRITVFSLSKVYDGTPLEFEESDYAVSSVPPEVKRQWVTATIRGSLTEAGELSLEEVAAQCSASATDDNGRDLTDSGENRIEFACDAAPLTVLSRAIEVTSVSVTRDTDETIYVSGEDCAYISSGSLAIGHRIEIQVDGKLLPNMQSARNTISSVRVTDALGNDVTRNYAITRKEGILTRKRAS